MGNAAFFKSRRMVSTQYGYIDMPITSQDKKVLKVSWPVIKKYWPKVCTVAFERYGFKLFCYSFDTLFYCFEKI